MRSIQMKCYLAKVSNWTVEQKCEVLAEYFVVHLFESCQTIDLDPACGNKISNTCCVMTSSEKTFHLFTYVFHQWWPGHSRPIKRWSKDRSLLMAICGFYIVDWTMVKPTSSYCLNQNSNLENVFFNLGKLKNFNNLVTKSLVSISNHTKAD